MFLDEGVDIQRFDILKYPAIDKITEKSTHLTKKDIEDSISEILDYTSNSLSEGNRIEVRGFGTFSVRKRNTRMARNPKTGSAVKVNSKYHPYFRAAKYLKSGLKD